MKTIKMLRAADVVLIAVLLAAGILALFLTVLKPQGEVSVAVITCAGEERYRIRLDAVETPYTIEIEDSVSVIIFVEPGNISFEWADCPDGLCVKTGKISRAGQTAVCLPSRVVLRIEGGASSEYDAVAR